MKCEHKSYSFLTLTFFIYILPRMRCAQCLSYTGLSCSMSLYVFYTGWDMWSVKVIMFSHPHLLSAAAAGWPGVAGAVSGQWESAWWLGRSLRRGREGGEPGGGKEGHERERSVKKKKNKNRGSPQRMMSRMPEVKHTSVTRVIEGGNVLLCLPAASHSCCSYLAVNVL